MFFRSPRPRSEGPPHRTRSASASPGGGDRSRSRGFPRKSPRSGIAASANPSHPRRMRKPVVPVATLRTRRAAGGTASSSGGNQMAIGPAPVLETLAEINGASLARTELDVQTLLLVRVAALVAADAPTASYLMHIEPLVVSDIELERIQDVLVAVAPIVGAPRVVSAA